MVARHPRTPSEQIGPDVHAAALEILGELGPDGFTVRSIAERAGVAPMAIYNHFSGKNGLLEEIWCEGFSILTEDMKVETSEPTHDLLEAGLAYRAFALGHGAHYTVMFMQRFFGFEPSPDAAYVAAGAFQMLVGHVERCQAAGHFTTWRAANVAQMLWAASHGYVSLEILGVNFSDSPDATYVDLLNGLLKGLSSP